MQIKYCLIILITCLFANVFAQGEPEQIPLDSLPPPTDTLAQPAVDTAAPPVAQKQCAKTYNINELLFKVKSGFQSKLNDCSSKLAKEMALAAIPFGKKSAAPEPKSFMKQCAVDGIKAELPDGFPNAVQIVGRLDNFVQTLLNAASSGGSLDPKKLASAVGSMNTDGLLDEVKKLAIGECVVNEPYTPADLAVDSAGNLAENSIPTNIPKESGSGGVSLGTVSSIVLAAGGLGAIIYGIAKNSEVSRNVDRRNGKAAVDAESSRNMGYGIGAALLAGGLIVYLVF